MGGRAGRDPVESLEEVGEDAGGGPPDEVAVEVIGVGPELAAVAGQDAAGVGGGEVGDRELDHGFDLARGGGEAVGGADQADERVDGEVGDEGGSGLEGAEELDVGGGEADLLVSLAEGRVDEVGVGRVAPAAGEGDLTGMVAKLVVAEGEDGVEDAVADIEGDEDGGLDPSVELERGRGGGLEEDRAERPRAGHAVSCMRSTRSVNITSPSSVRWIGHLAAMILSCWTW